MEDVEFPNEVNDCVEVDEKDNVWSDTTEKYLIELMVEEVKKGNRTTTTFSKSAWKAIKEGVKTKFGKEYTDVQLKNKYNQLRARQKNFKALIKETGIGYNAFTGQANATDECWERLSKVHKMAKRFKRRGCKEYPDLCLIFGDTTATGVHAHPSTKSPSLSEEESHNVDINIDISSKDNEEVEAIAPLNNKSSRTESQKKKNKRTYSSILEKALSTIGEQSKRKNDLLEQKLVASTSSGESGVEATSSTTREVNVMKECLKALNTLGIEGAPYGKAVKALHDSPLYRDIFLDMPDERKRDWVLSL